MVHLQGLHLTISSELAAYFCSGTPSPHSYLLKVLTKALLLPSSILECFLYCEISEKKNDIFTNLYFLGVQHIVSNYLMAGWLDGWMDGCCQQANLMLFSFSCLTSYKAIIIINFFIYLVLTFTIHWTDLSRWKQLDQCHFYQRAPHCLPPISIYM